MVEDANDAGAGVVPLDKLGVRLPTPSFVGPFFAERGDGAAVLSAETAGPASAGAHAGEVRQLQAFLAKFGCVRYPGHRRCA